MREGEGEGEWTVLHTCVGHVCIATYKGGREGSLCCISEPAIFNKKILVNQPPT